jgi:hypothetical protein
VITLLEEKMNLQEETERTEDERIIRERKWNHELTGMGTKFQYFFLETMLDIPTPANQE